MLLIVLFLALILTTLLMGLGKAFKWSTLKKRVVAGLKRRTDLGVCSILS